MAPVEGVEETTNGLLAKRGGTSESTSDFSELASDPAV